MPRRSSETQKEPKENESEGRYQCTGCEEYILTSFDAFLHPLLKCLVCRKCHGEYKTGDFSQFDDGVDEDGVDNFCRWCVDGGDMFACGNSPKDCKYVFCHDCIKRNVPDDPVLTSNDDSEKFHWNCYGCDPTPLEVIRKHAQAAILDLSQKDLSRKGPTATPQGHADKSASNGNRKDSETTEHPQSPAVASRGKQASSSSGSKNEKVDNDDTSESDRKKRKTEAAAAVAPEPERRESLLRKEKDKKKEEEVARDPESIMKPPELMKPKAAQTSLRSLAAGKTTTLTATKPSPATPVSIPRGTSVTQSASKQQPPASNTASRSSLPSAPAPRASQPPASTPKQQAPATTASATPNATTVSSSRPKTTAGENPTKINHVPHQNLRSVSKGLKVSNEQIKPTTKVTLTEHDLKARLENYGSIKDKCVKEINIKFQNIIEMFTTKDLDSKTIIKNEIEDLERPLQEFNTMLVNLKSLYSSQS